MEEEGIQNCFQKDSLFTEKDFRKKKRKEKSKAIETYKT